MPQLHGLIFVEFFPLISMNIEGTII